MPRLCRCQTIRGYGGRRSIGRVSGAGHPERFGRPFTNSGRWRARLWTRRAGPSARPHKSTSWTGGDGCAGAGGRFPFGTALDPLDIAVSAVIDTARNSCLTVPHGDSDEPDSARRAPVPSAQSWPPGQPPSLPRSAGFRGARCVFVLQKPLAGGYPGPPNDTMGAPKEAARFGTDVPMRLAEPAKSAQRVGLDHAVQGHRPGDPPLMPHETSRAGVAATADEARFEASFIRPGLSCASTCAGSGAIAESNSFLFAIVRSPGRACTRLVEASRWFGCETETSEST